MLVSRIVRMISLAVAVIGSLSGAVMDARADVPAAVRLEPTALHLKTGKVPLDATASMHLGPALPLAKEGHFVVQLDGPLTPQRAADLLAAGVTLGQYLPSNAFIVRLEAGYNVAARLGAAPFVRWVGPFDTAWKLDSEIGQIAYQTPERIALAAQGQYKLLVALFEGEDLNAATGRIAAIPGTIIVDSAMSAGVGLVELIVPQANYQGLADIDEVQWVEDAAEIVLRNNTNRWILQSNSNGVMTEWTQGIHGENQVGGLIDGGVRQTHCSFTEAGKFAGYFGSTTADFHGTHTAGTFVGDERPGDNLGFRGMAYKAKLAFTNLGTITSANLNSKLVQNHDVGARVHSNSWGNDGTTNYISWSRDIDVFSYANEEDLVLFAITNLNDSVKTPENAKNCLAVAASTDTPATNHCSGGNSPTNDGRQKPELLAPGCGTISSQSSTSCGFTSLTGTSMACPAVSGAGLLVRQYFTDGYYPSGVVNAADAFTPSGALIRAVMVNSGVNMTGIAGFPSNREGWGRVLLDNALYFAGDEAKLFVLDDIRNANGLTTGGSKNYTLVVEDNGIPLKATLVWTEKEAALNANPAYINDLNLEVIAPGNVVYRGNFFSGGQSVAGGTADFKNNLEQVLINNPLRTRYEFKVQAQAVNTTLPQGFALVVTGAVKSIGGLEGKLKVLEPERSD